MTNSNLYNIENLIQFVNGRLSEKETIYIQNKMQADPTLKTIIDGIEYDLILNGSSDSIEEFINEAHQRFILNSTGTSVNETNLSNIHSSLSINPITRFLCFFKQQAQDKFLGFFRVIQAIITYLSSRRQNNYDRFRDYDNIYDNYPYHHPREIVHEQYWDGVHYSHDYSISTIIIGIMAIASIGYCVVYQNIDNNVLMERDRSYIVQNQIDRENPMYSEEPLQPEAYSHDLGSSEEIFPDDLSGLSKEIYSGALETQTIFIQVGSFLIFDNANRLMNSLINQGKKACVVSSNVNNQMFYRVMVGPFESMDEAKAYASDKKLGHTYYIQTFK